MSLKKNSGPDIAAEIKVVPAWAGTLGLSRCFSYCGNSMMPTFRPGQLLYVRPAVGDISPGDVIVFGQSPPSDFYIVHRVVSATGVGLITRGDNKQYIDLSPVAPNRVIGRVEMLDDNGHLKSVRGGKWALWAAQLRWSTRWAVSMLRRIIGFPYRVLRRSKTARQFLWCVFAPQFDYATFQTPQGTVVKVFHRGKIVARWYPHANRFECDKPYDLVIPRPDEK